ncbi:Arc family DNA-binding protein [Sinorhizobium meliloti]|uniref:Arc family DNA-binding protein n=1 Tax=Rhizobium meliloti TaxID=382 RepID=UPI000FD914C2|nr:Arc family DNA-binding protein [Sinorhizobium meliloti]MCM5689131.1 Arc family DNA-binding protein [Sinorhizobium meliloti]MCO6425455.1 Arc family DNA-binding protein [Sinorhizobium meliloti]RVM17649.1 Arc family DNA-binding protein [Sinorhizobium meliloti]RVO19494.1 Arc family DNA-binding protein [Sinorhizobium meliloti]
MTEETKQFKLMIPLEMKRWLAIEAAKNMRSQNAEILIAIRERMERLEKEKGAAQS